MLICLNKIYLHVVNDSAEPFLGLLNFGLIETKTLQESCQIFVEHALLVARIQFEHSPKSRLLGTAGSVTTIGLSINGCSLLILPV